jgi:hypothetical protein
VAGDSVKQLSEVNDGVGVGIVEPVCSKFTGSEGFRSWVRRRVGKSKKRLSGRYAIDWYKTKRRGIARGSVEPTVRIEQE